MHHDYTCGHNHEEMQAAKNCKYHFTQIVLSVVSNSMSSCHRKCWSVVISSFQTSVKFVRYESNLLTSSESLVVKHRIVMVPRKGSALFLIFTCIRMFKIVQLHLQMPCSMKTSTPVGGKKINYLGCTVMNQFYTHQMHVFLLDLFYNQLSFLFKAFSLLILLKASPFFYSFEMEMHFEGGTVRQVLILPVFAACVPS